MLSNRSKFFFHHKIVPSARRAWKTFQIQIKGVAAIEKSYVDFLGSSSQRIEVLEPYVCAN